MGHRQKEWARKQRAALTAVLGNECRVCGSHDSLCFDCRAPTGSAHHSYDSSHRMSYYRAEWRKGNLALLCHWCNSMKAGLKPAEWQSAMLRVRESERIMLLSQPPGEGNALTPAQARECLREAVSMCYASRRDAQQRKSDKSLAPLPVV